MKLETVLLFGVFLLGLTAAGFERSAPAPNFEHEVGMRHGSSLNALAVDRSDAMTAQACRRNGVPELVALGSHGRAVAPLHFPREEHTVFHIRPPPAI